jgi:hypothetical protein
VIAIGTVCRLSERRCAVTVISSRPGVSAGLVSAANSGVVPHISQANRQEQLTKSARAGAECKEPNIVILPKRFFVRRRSRAPRLSAALNDVSPVREIQVHNAHYEITGVVAVCTIHNSVDEQAGLRECAAKESGRLRAKTSG